MAIPLQENKVMEFKGDISELDKLEEQIEGAYFN